jgi:uncharacterized membrane protein
MGYPLYPGGPEPPWWPHPPERRGGKGFTVAGVVTGSVGIFLAVVGFLVRRHYEGANAFCLAAGFLAADVHACRVARTMFTLGTFTIGLGAITAIVGFVLFLVGVGKS